MALSVQITCSWSTTDSAQKIDTGFITPSVLQTRSARGIILRDTSRFRFWADAGVVTVGEMYMVMECARSGLQSYEK